MRLGALLFLLYACAADDVEVYDEEPAVDEEESEVGTAPRLVRLAAVLRMS